MTPTSARFSGRVIAAGLLCAAQSAARVAVADESVALVWQGAAGTEGCSGAQELQRAAEVQMGRNVFSSAETTAKLTIVVKVERREEPQGFHATVWVQAEDRRDPGTRELDAPGDDCRALDEPLALVVALMADSELARPVEEEAPPPPEPEPPPPPPQKRVEEKDDRELVPIETGPPPDHPTRWHAELGASALGGYAVLPALSVGAELSLILDPGSFPAVMLHGAAFYPRVEQVGPDASVTFFFAHGGASLCPELASSNSGKLRGCVGAIAGALRAEIGRAHV